MKKNSNSKKTVENLETIIENLIETNISFLAEDDKEEVEILINEAVISIENAIEVIENGA